MVLSDVSIRRPVFATVMSLLLVVLGVIAYTRLTLRELPAIDPPVVSVSVEYPGASAAVVETRITQVLEDALSGIEGVEVQVKVPYGPDPYNLIEGGDVELWGSGGGILDSQKVKARRGDITWLRADFPDTGFLENYEGNLLVRVLAKDSSGVVIASAGIG